MRGVSLDLRGAFYCRGRSFCPSCEKKRSLLWVGWPRPDAVVPRAPARPHGGATVAPAGKLKVIAIHRPFGAPTQPARGREATPDSARRGSRPRRRRRLGDRRALWHKRQSGCERQGPPERLTRAAAWR